MIRPVLFVPEIRLHQAEDETALWHSTEDELSRIGLPPPFWAFAWPGGQGLARYVLDHPELVRGRRVIDFASGSGLVAIAASMAGAASVTAVDIDPFAGASIRGNSAINRNAISQLEADIVGQIVDADVLLAGDVFYDSGMTARILPWFDDLAAAGITVVAGDPGRTYRPTTGYEILASYDVPVERAIEEADVKTVAILRYAGRAEQVVSDQEFTSRGLRETVLRS